MKTQGAFLLPREEIKITQMLPKTTTTQRFLKPHNRFCFNFFQWVPWFIEGSRSFVAGWAEAAGMWDFNPLFWNRQGFNRWGGDNHWALDLQSHLSVCSFALMLQNLGHGCGHVAVQPLASGGGCTRPLLSPYWLMWWKRTVQLVLKYRGPDLRNLMEGKDLSSKELLFLLAWPLQHTSD